ncbi:MAG: polysulfide reductase NrfD [Nitrospiraceae bacterium]|nr:MAG: polysulfide reductase NrfD [Nitrospiraceae bacterium]
MEQVITGLNSITHPHLEVWDWTVAVYLFLGGLAAGLLVMSAVANLRNWPDDEEGPHCIKGALYAPLILAIGMIFIFLDLERKTNMYWFFLSFQTFSPMSWGAWGITITIPLSFLYGLSTVPAGKRNRMPFAFLKRWSVRLEPHMRKLAMINFGLGIFVGIYTGILLSAMLARPLWNSSILPVLFLNSAISTGAAFLIIVAHKSAVKLFYTKVDIWLIFSEIMIIMLFFYSQYTSTAAAKASAMPFFTLSHEYFFYFLSIMIVAILLPLALVLKLIEMQEDHAETLSSATIFRMNLSAIMVLIGGLIIRFAFIYAGQLSTFS